MSARCVRSYSLVAAFGLHCLLSLAIAGEDASGLSLLQLTSQIHEGGLNHTLNRPANMTFHSQAIEIFMHYMPEHDVVVCGCGKCGSTSMFQYIYKQKFKHDWDFKGAPFVQEVTSDRWEGAFQWKTDIEKQKQVMSHATSFALIRDPKERLVSAWKSKITCDDDSFGVDKDERAHWIQAQGRYRGFVAALQRLRGADENITCLSLEDFAEALYDIKQKNMTRFLDRHFLPQQLGCFKRFPPEQWTKVSTIRDESGLKLLADKLGGTEDIQVPELHASPNKLLVSKKAAYFLDLVTAKEYEIIGPYLGRPSWVQADTWF